MWGSVKYCSIVPSCQWHFVFLAHSQPNYFCCHKFLVLLQFSHFYSSFLAPILLFSCTLLLMTHSYHILNHAFIHQALVYAVHLLVYKPSGLDL